MNLANLQLQLKNAMLWSDMYQKEKLVHSPKLFHFFFVEANEISCKVEVTGKRVNLGNGERLQKYSDKLKDTLPALL